MLILKIIGGILAAGFLMAKLRGRANEKPSVTRLQMK
jgi:hypothetical protein